MLFRRIIFFFLFFICLSAYTQSLTNQPVIVYLFPGQGSDSRIFQNIQLKTDCEVVSISYPVPEKGITMKDYALSFIVQMDTTKPFVLIGVSLGGMICSELSNICNPEKTIIISSANGRSELPVRYRFMRYFPVYKLVPARMMKAGAFIVQPIIEPDRRHGKKTFISMLKAKDPLFIKRTTEMIINWNLMKKNTKIIHIHGTSDHTLPIRKVRPDYIIQKGSHMMIYTRGDEISALVNSIITGKEN